MAVDPWSAWKLLTSSKISIAFGEENASLPELFSAEHAISYTVF